jgi:hypothetical protein
MIRSSIKEYFNPKNYIRKCAELSLYTISPAIKIWEERKTNRYALLPLSHQPIFIIGAPRTGSTILYQTITNKFDVLYVDNLICKFHNNLFFGFWLSNKIFKQRAHNCFNSQHGDTKDYGFHAPSECGGFWYRWLPRDRHFIDNDEISDQMVAEIRREITGVINYFQKPLVFNNNNAGMRIRLLKQCYPNAKYIVADRSPLYVAQSLLRVRKSVNGSYEKWWSIMPKNYQDLRKKDCFEQVVLQHYYINKQIFCDLESISYKNHMTVTYNNFSLNKNDVMDKFSEYINYQAVREYYEENEVVESRENSLDEDSIEYVNKIIGSLDWNDYKS